MANPRFARLRAQLDGNVDTAAIVAAMPDATPGSIATAAQSIVDWMMTDTAGVDAEIDGGTLYDLVDEAERAALTAAQKTELNIIFGTTGIRLHTGSKARTALLGMFGAGSVTRTAFAAALSTTVKNYQKFGMPSPNFHDIEIALGV